ncbi:tRNA (adenosine(37)-N6)-dimethylallyltransferase MiaA [Campylobacter sputorum]|uniref:tRNA (adenosine(37)-N6)-dimethylallyltransferase MiaA n=1 Tax=Campylobacter sputorum TaxID=206 RepID=UPI0035570C2B
MLELAIIGTTASGKSDLAIELALRYNAVILSLDSLCLYKEINIASAKPSLDELNLVLHFGINLVYPDEYFSVGEFIKEYQKASDYAKKHSKNLIITGGSGFYLNAMLKGLAPKFDDITIDISDDEIWELACKFDTNFVNKFSKNDKFRLHKWYQIYKTTSQIPSKYLKENRQEPIIKGIKIFEIQVPKELLNKKINIRTQKMLNMGLIDEAKYLSKKYGTHHKSINCIGLKETFSYLRNEISKQNLIELINTHTIQLAKRQRTFNKSQFIINKFSAPIDEVKLALSSYLSKQYI